VFGRSRSEPALSTRIQYVGFKTQRHTQARHVVGGLESDAVELGDGRDERETKPCSSRPDAAF
jgi:hypothetical protein